jgi:hypothetical protein
VALILTGKILGYKRMLICVILRVDLYRF